VGGRAVLWAEPPDDSADNRPETEAHRALDDAVTQRRLRRWLKGMFGGDGERDGENNEHDARADS
jgi:hypothetical protein